MADKGNISEQRNLWGTEIGLRLRTFGCRTEEKYHE